MKNIQILILVLVLSGAVFAQDTLKLDLDKSIDLALKFNHDLKIARLDKQKADEQITEAWGSSIFPKLSGFINYNRAIKRGEISIETPFFSGTFPQGTENTMTLGASLEQPLFTGAIFLAVKIAETYADIQEKMVDATTSEVIVNVKKAYYSVLLAHEVLNLSKLNLKLAEDNLKNTESLYNAGVAPEYDFVRAKVQVKNLIPDLQQSENSLVLAKNLLKLVTGVDLSKEMEITDSLYLKEVALSGEEELDQILLEKNNTLLGLRLQMQLQENDVSYQFTKHFPELYFNGSWQAQAQENDPRPFSDWRYVNSVYVGLNLKIPIFDGFQTTSKVAQAKIDYYRTKEEYDKNVKVLKNNLKDILLSIDETKKKLDSYKATIEEAELAYSIAQKRYSSGVGTQLETIDAMVSLTRAKVNYYNSVYEYYILLAQLDQILGRE